MFDDIALRSPTDRQRGAHWEHDDRCYSSHSSRNETTIEYNNRGDTRSEHSRNSSGGHTHNHAEQDACRKRGRDEDAEGFAHWDQKRTERESHSQRGRSTVHQSGLQKESPLDNDRLLGSGKSRQRRINAGELHQDWDRRALEQELQRFLRTRDQRRLDALPDPMMHATVPSDPPDRSSQRRRADPEEAKTMFRDRERFWHQMSEGIEDRLLRHGSRIPPTATVNEVTPLAHRNHSLTTSLAVRPVSARDFASATLRSRREQRASTRKEKEKEKEEACSFTEQTSGPPLPVWRSPVVANGAGKEPKVEAARRETELPQIVDCRAPRKRPEPLPKPTALDVDIEMEFRSWEKPPKEVQTPQLQTDQHADTTEADQQQQLGSPTSSRRAQGGKAVSHPDAIEIASTSSCSSDDKGLLPLRQNPKGCRVSTEATGTEAPEGLPEPATPPLPPDLPSPKTTPSTGMAADGSVSHDETSDTDVDIFADHAWLEEEEAAKTFQLDAIWSPKLPAPGPSTPVEQDGKAPAKSPSQRSEHSPPPSPPDSPSVPESPPAELEPEARDSPARLGEDEDEDEDEDEEEEEEEEDSDSLSPITPEPLEGPLEESLNLPLPEPGFRKFAVDVCELCGLGDHTTSACTNCICRSCMQYGHWDCGNLVPRLCKHCLRDTHPSQDCVQERFHLTLAMADLPIAVWTELPCCLSSVQPVSLATWRPAIDRLLHAGHTSGGPAQLGSGPSTGDGEMESRPDSEDDVPASPGLHSPLGTLWSVQEEGSDSELPAAEALDGGAADRADHLCRGVPQRVLRGASPVSNCGPRSASKQPSGCEPKPFGEDLGLAQPRLQRLEVRCFVCGKSGHFDCSRPPSRAFAHCCVCSLTDHRHDQCPFLALRPMPTAT
eukprot:GGOE01015151.1.p1 GENE.GGOE01015151.1~~GGOE01015151.1.p1  ORF type:complete len:925 (+),score=84.89 GGOE01015151.1:107-2776(+)